MHSVSLFDPVKHCLACPQVITDAGRMVQKYSSSKISTTIEIIFLRRRHGLGSISKNKLKLNFWVSNRAMLCVESAF